MKQHTAEFKQELTKMGKQIDSVITYTLNNETITLHDELYAVTPMFEANLLKSVMKQLDVESSVMIPYGTVINYKLGLLVGENYEYLDYGNYIVYSNEKQEDTDTYKITCFDKMLNSMKPYEEIRGTYPITIKEYLVALGQKIGLTVKDTNFYNYSLQIHEDLYKDLNYTYRDVLDEIAQATGSFIIINEDDQIEVKYPTDTGDTINEEFFKDANVNFSKKYGPVNSIVLSRGAESDNVYIQDEESIRENGLCELKIKDNQIMNFNDRSDYLEGLLSALDGIEYYENDYDSIGILYYDIGDYYNVQIGDKTYKCIMLNSEINVTSGIEEIIHTDLPEASETDYTKADKTDRKINQTYLIVDKQNQKIESVVTQVDKQNDKISQIQQTTDNIEIQVANMYNATKTVRANKTVVLPKCIKGYLLKLRILGNNTVFDRLYPADDLYPSDTLYPRGDSRIIVTDKNGNSQVYELRVPSVLRANSEVYDEYILENNYAKIIRRVNADGTTKINEETEVIGTYTIYLAQDENTIEIQNYDGILEAVYVEQNAYTDQFATKIEMNSAIDVSQDSVITTVNKKLINEYSTSEEVSAEIDGEVSNAVTEMTSTITQTAESINSVVRKKVGKDEVISSINQSDEAVQINANKISLNGKTIKLTSENVAIQSNNFSVDKNGNMTSKSGTIAGWNISQDNIYKSNASVASNGNWAFMCGGNDYNNVNSTAPFRVGFNGDMHCSDANITGGRVEVSGGGNTGTADGLNIVAKNSEFNYGGIAPGFGIVRGSRYNYINMSADGSNANQMISGDTNNYITSSVMPTYSMVNTLWHSSGSSSQVSSTGIITPTVTQTSKESTKKNIQKYGKNALDIVNNSDLYEYNYKFEKDTDKKHIGFIIGDEGGNYKTPNEVIAQSNEGIDNNNMTSILWKAVQEQQEIIDELKKEIKELKGGN